MKINISEILNIHYNITEVVEERQFKLFRYLKRMRSNRIPKKYNGMPRAGE